MSLEILKQAIESYDSKSITSDQLEGLRTMLEHDIFEPLYPTIVKKIHEIKTQMDKQEKLYKRIKKAKDKVDNSYKRNEIPKNFKKPPIENVILSFTFDIPPEELISRKVKEPKKPKDKKDT